MKKILVSVLGAGNYRGARYIYEGHEMQTDYTPVFLAELLGVDRLILVGTEGSNWDFARERLKGIRSDYLEIVIPYGKNEEELWQAFLELVEKLSRDMEDCELYFDITHGFRSLPLFLFAVIGWIELFSKNVEVKGILYGMFEKENQPAVVVNLKPVLDLLRLTDACKLFISFGDAFSLYEKLKEFEKDLNEEERRLYGQSELKSIAEIIKSIGSSYALNAVDTYYRKLADLSEKIQRTKRVELPTKFIPVLKLYGEVGAILDKELKSLGESKYGGFLSLAKKYAENRRFSQTVEVLREGFINFILQKAGVEAGDRKNREKLIGLLSIGADFGEASALASRISDMRNKVAHAFTAREVRDSEVRNMTDEIKQLIQEVERFCKNASLNWENIRMLLSEETC